jgi:hypothetical protein
VAVLDAGFEMMMGHGVAIDPVGRQGIGRRPVRTRF